MSANLDLVHSILASWERGELTPEQWSEWADPEMEFVVVGGPEAGSYVGAAEAGPRIEAFLNLWEDYRVEAEEYRELDDERVLVLTRQTGRGRNSLVATTQQRATLFQIRDGKVVRRVNYWERDLAFAELGLEE